MGKRAACGRTVKNVRQLVRHEKECSRCMNTIQTMLWEVNGGNNAVAEENRKSARWGERGMGARENGA
jgi:hypothetical protein